MLKVPHFAIWLLRNEFEHRLTRVVLLFRRRHVQATDCHPDVAWTWRRCWKCGYHTLAPIGPCRQCGGAMYRIEYVAGAWRPLEVS